MDRTLPLALAALLALGLGVPAQAQQAAPPAAQQAPAAAPAPVPGAAQPGAAQPEAAQAGPAQTESAPAPVETEGADAEELGLTDEAVEETVDQLPTRQGTRAPNLLDGEEDLEGQAIGLYELLARVRAAPPGLDGEPIPRPNPWASEPTTEMVPMQVQNPSLFLEGYIE